MVEGFSDMQCKLRSIHLPFSPIATHRTSFYYSVRTQNTVTKIKMVVTMQWEPVCITFSSWTVTVVYCIGAVYLSGLPLEVHQNPEESS